MLHGFIFICFFDDFKLGCCYVVFLFSSKWVSQSFNLFLASDLIQKAKEGGLGVIQIYVFWNGHEPSPGKVIDDSYHFCLLCLTVHVSLDKLMLLVQKKNYKI